MFHFIFLLKWLRFVVFFACVLILNLVFGTPSGNFLMDIDKKLLLRELIIRKGVLYVNEILS
jgi:hypothetical protein